MLMFKNKDTFYYDNFTNKPLREFTSKDTLYVSKTKNNFSNWYFCKFVKFEKGIVHAEIMEKQKEWSEGEVGDTLTIRPTSCCLWGRENARYFFHWFNLDGTLRRY